MSAPMTGTINRFDGTSERERTMRSVLGRVAAASLVLLLSVPLAGAAQSTYAIRGGAVHTLAGDVIENGTVVMVDGRITAVGADVQVPSGAMVVDASGLHVYPGMFDAMTNLGLTEIGQVDVTNDFREIGEYNPHLVAATAVHPASEHIPVARANGVTHALTAPQGRSGGLAGQGTLINLDGWTIEEMTVKQSVGMVLTWPTIQTREFDFNTFSVRERSFREAQEEYQEELRSLKEWFESARHQVKAQAAAGARVERDLKLEAIGRAMAGELPVIITVNEERDIRNAIEFAEEQGLDFVIAGAEEAWKIADWLAEKNVRLILGATQSMPSGPDGSYDEAYANPGKVHQAGVKFAIATFSSSDVRTLPYEAAQAVAFGLPHDEALRAITLYPAEIFGVADLVGTIEPGKIGNVIVTDGDPLEIQTQIHHLFIDGVPVTLDNKHLRLYEKYRSRPMPTGR